MNRTNVYSLEKSHHCTIRANHKNGCRNRRKYPSYKKKTWKKNWKLHYKFVLHNQFLNVYVTHWEFKWYNVLNLSNQNSALDIAGFHLRSRFHFNFETPKNPLLTTLSCFHNDYIDPSNEFSRYELTLNFRY